MYKVTVTFNGNIQIGSFYFATASDIDKNRTISLFRSFSDKLNYSEVIEEIDFEPIRDSFIEAIRYDDHNFTSLSIHNTVEDVIDTYQDSYKIVSLDLDLYKRILNTRYGLLGRNPENKPYNAPIILTREIKI